MKKHKFDSTVDKIYDEESRILCEANVTNQEIEYELNDTTQADIDNINPYYNKILIFSKIFTLIFITEMGYKTQISSVNLSSIIPLNRSNNTLFFSIIFVHLLNNFISIGIGVVIKKFIPKWIYEVMVISGAMLMALAVNMLYLTIFHDLFLNKFQKEFFT